MANLWKVHQHVPGRGVREDLLVCEEGPGESIGLLSISRHDVVHVGILPFPRLGKRYHPLQAMESIDSSQSQS